MAVCGPVGLGYRDVVHKSLEIVEHAGNAVGLRGLGRVSYGFYLWHFFLLLCLAELARHHTREPIAGWGDPLVLAALLVAGGAAALAVSWLSWFVLESPLLKLKRRFAPAAAPEAP